MVMGRGTVQAAALRVHRFSVPLRLVPPAVVVVLAMLWVCVPRALSQAAQDSVGPIVAALRSRDFADALALSQSAVAAQPGDYRVWTLYGLAAGGMGRLPDALAAYRRALHLQPSYLPALEGAAQTQMQLGQDAKPLLLKILAQRPDDPATLTLLGILDYRSNNCPAAVESFRKAAPAVQHEPEALTDEGVCLSALDRYDDATAAFTDALALDPSSQVARYNLALAQFSAHRFDDALATVQPLLAATPAHTDALALAAAICESKGDTARAVTLLRSALLADPRDVDAYLQFAALSFDHASPQVGIDVVNAGIGRLPNEPRLYLVRGILLAQMGEFGRAADDFDAASRLDPQLQFLGVAQGLVQSQQHNPGEALAHFRAAVKAHPREAYAYYLLAEALAARGEPEGSPEYSEEINAARTAVRLDPRLVAARDLLSTAYYANGHMDEAIRQSRAALATNPDDEPAMYHLMLALRKTGHNDEARALVEQMVKLRTTSKADDAPARHYHLYEESASRAASLSPAGVR